MAPKAPFRPRGMIMGFGPLLTTRIEVRNGVAAIALVGELDMGTVAVLEQQLAQYEGNGVKAIMLDLRDLTFIDSSGLRAFLAARNRSASNGHRLILLGASESARHLFEITGIQFLLDEQEAVGLLDLFTAGHRPRDEIVDA